MAVADDAVHPGGGKPGHSKAKQPEAKQRKQKAGKPLSGAKIVYSPVQLLRSHSRTKKRRCQHLTAAPLSAPLRSFPRPRSASFRFLPLPSAGSRIRFRTRRLSPSLSRCGARKKRVVGSAQQSWTRELYSMLRRNERTNEKKRNGRSLVSRRKQASAERKKEKRTIKSRSEDAHPVASSTSSFSSLKITSLIGGRFVASVMQHCST